MMSNFIENEEIEMGDEAVESEEAGVYLYSIDLNIQTREFKGQTSGVTKCVIQIGCNSAPDFKHQLWTKMSDKLKREIVFDDNNDPQWHANISPKEEDMDRFVLFYDSKAKRSMGVDKINSVTLTHWRKKEIWLYVHVYSMSVANLTLWKKVQKCLLEPMNRDRAGASNTSEVNALVSRLKEVHRQNYQSQHINWLIWATKIQSSESHLYEKMVNNPPPPDILHLFAHARTSADDVVTGIKQNLYVAENVNDGVTSGLSRVISLVEDIRKIQDAITKLQSEEKTKFDLLEHELQSMEIRAEATRSLISSMERSMPATESDFGRQLFAQIQDQEDVDHA